MKKGLSILLALVMVLSIMMAVPVCVSAEEEAIVPTRATTELASTGWTIRTSYPGTSLSYYKPPVNNFRLSPYNGGNCTWYAYGRAIEATGVTPKVSGDAINWYNEAKANGMSVGSTPKAGSIGCYLAPDGTYGHVCFVEAVNGSLVTVTDSNYQFGTEWTLSNFNIYRDKDPKTIYIDQNKRTFSLIGFIYLGSAPNPITPTQCVSDGDYHIISALDNSLGLNIAYNSTDSCANVQLWNNMEESNLTSLVTVKHVGSGYYTLTFRNSGKNLDVSNASNKSGANVWQYDANNSDAQKWIIKPTGDGYFNIITKLNTNLNLDVSGGAATAGANIQIYTANTTNAQKWRFTASGMTTGKTIENGEYTISSAISQYACINLFGGKTDDGTNVHLWNNMGFNVDNAVVNVTYLDNGLYSIIFKKSGKSLDIDGHKNTNGANVQQWTYYANNAQKWIIKSAGDGYYYIISRCSGLAVDAQNSSSENGANVQSYLWKNVNAQKWKFNLNKYNISYDPNGGQLYNDTITTCIPDGYNSGRGGAQIIVYTGVYGTKTNTNIYGDEYAFDENGKKVGVRYYGTEAGLNIPAGGFVVSKHAQSAFDLYNIGEQTEFAYLDTSTNTIYFCKNKHDYNVVSKKAALGREYGELAVPENKGLVFDGWYTESEGGERITSNSIFSGVTKLYAHWKKETEIILGDADGDNEVTILDATAIQRHLASLPTQSYNATAADTDKDGEVTILDATAIQRHLASLPTQAQGIGEPV